MEAKEEMVVEEILIMEVIMMVAPEILNEKTILVVPEENLVELASIGGGREKFG